MSFFFRFYSNHGSAWFPLPGEIRQGNEVVLISVQDESSKEMVAENVFLWSLPKDIVGLGNNVSISVHSIKKLSDSEALVTLQSDRLAIFVTLTTRAQGRFSKNCFTLKPLQATVSSLVPTPVVRTIPLIYQLYCSPRQTVRFHSLVPNETIDIDVLRSSLRVEHLGSYISTREGTTAILLEA